MPIPIGQTCTTCGGDGYIGETLCTDCFCGGSIPPVALNLIYKFMYDGIVSEIDKVDQKIDISNVFHSYQILEALDVDEYNALTATQKDGVKVLLSCGLVDLNDGKAGRVRLWNWFGAESTTVANLTALLS